ncbi:MAG: hypothetical protein GX058_04305 [Firmicutes bacterium]|nr:hypothetical protein [Bacillota bacterium]
MLEQLTGVVTKHGPHRFTARCLELEIHSEGSSAEEAKNRLITAIQQHIDDLVETGAKDPKIGRYPAQKRELTNTTAKDSMVFEMPNHLIFH